MKSTADIVMIGAGVHGARLAFHLASAGAGSIVVLEKNHVAARPTAKSGAMIRPLFAQAVYIHLVVEATAMFEHWHDCVGGDAGFVQKGLCSPVCARKQPAAASKCLAPASQPATRRRSPPWLGPVFAPDVPPRSWVY